jgi:hypothetical protein
VEPGGAGHRLHHDASSALLPQLSTSSPQERSLGGELTSLPRSRRRAPPSFARRGADPVEHCVHFGELDRG